MHGFDSRCANGGQGTGDDCGEQKASHHDREDYRIERAGSVEDGADERGCRRATGQAYQQSEEDWAQSIKQHQTQHLSSLRTERDADANLRDALSNEIREHSIKTDSGEQQRQ